MFAGTNTIASFACGRGASPDPQETLHDLVAESMGTTVEVQIPMSSAYPVTFNNHELADRMRPVLEALAPGKVVNKPAVTGAEDFSFIAEKVPGMYIALGGRPSNVREEDAPGHHTPEFSIDDSGLGLGVRAMTAMALHYLGSSSTAAPAKP